MSEKFGGSSGGDVQKEFFRFTDNVPEEAWYWLAMFSITASATLRIMGKKNWSLFVGQWPPTFLILGVYHRLVRPSSS